MLPLAVMLAAERVRADAANTMRHDTTSDLTPRLMCRVGVHDLGLVMAWVEQHRAADPREDDPTREGIFRSHNCWRCQDGKKPCVQGAPNRCDNPRARND